MKYHVAIIGGGLAGLSLSIDLTKRGYNVVVIEKGNYPRHKVCGEYISMESHDYLYSICPALMELNLPIIKHFRLTSTGSLEFKTTLDLGGFGVSRYLIEELLYLEACKLGVVFKLLCKAKNIEFDHMEESYFVRTNTDTVCASLVCNASGRRSNFEAKNKDNQVNGINYVGIKYHVKLHRDATLIEIHNFPGGYCGISNIEENKSCLCYMVNAQQLKKAHNNIPELEKTILYRNKALKSIFTNAEFLYKEPLTISGINFRIKPFEKNGAFLLGDAAGSISPITGNGMSMALRSASVLAEDIDAYFSTAFTKPQLIKQYDDFWEKQFSGHIKLSRYFQKLSEYPFLTNATIGLFHLFPALAQKMIKLTHGQPF